MKNTYRCILAGIIIFSLLLAACNPKETYTVDATPGLTGIRPSISAWDELVNAAKKEGEVMVYASELGAAQNALKKAFREKFGIAVDFIAGRPQETLAKLAAERRAGLYLGDAGLMGRDSFINEVRPLGATVPLPPLFVLPEVTDLSKWRDGKLLYLDKEQHSLIMVGQANYPSIRNTDLVKEGEIKSFLDYLEPKWKGKIVLSDPALGGSASNYFTYMATKVFGMEKTLEILHKLAAQEPMVTRNQRLFTEWVAKGKYPIGIGHSLAQLAEFRKAGAPLALVSHKEPPYVAAGSGNIFIFDKAPHPNAAKLFLNWILTKEGATVWSQGQGYPSLRLDVTTEGFDPVSVLPPGATFPDEAYFRAQGEMRKISGDIFARLLKE